MVDPLINPRRKVVKQSSKRKTFPFLPKLIVSDFDGVMTDNRVVVSQDGVESVTCSRADGLGIELLKQTGIEFMVLSTEKNPVVEARCRKLQIPFYQGLSDKFKALREFAAQRGIPLSDICYIGNDLNDQECIAGVGCGVAVSDAHPKILKAAQFVLSRRGGDGAVRELCEIVRDLACRVL